MNPASSRHRFHSSSMAKSPVPHKLLGRWSSKYCRPFLETPKTLVQELCRETCAENIAPLPMEERRILCQSSVLVSMASTAFLWVSRQILWDNLDIAVVPQFQEIGSRPQRKRIGLLSRDRGVR